MHGLGNDFIFIMKNEFLKVANQKEFIRNISNRRLGIGCDQVILYSDSYEKIYDMEVFNHDGSRAEACGNGARCLARLLNHKYNYNDLKIESSKRILLANIKDNLVSINMGQASFHKDWMVKEESLINMSNIFSFNLKEILQVDMLNPHLVIFYNNLTDEDKEIISGQVNNSKIFDKGVNINFARINKDVINLDVWERGVGQTLSCGTGACATFAAAKKLGFINNNATIKFKLGNLKIKEEKSEIIMKGPANFIAKGEYYYE